MKQAVNPQTITQLIIKHYPLIPILIASFLVAVSMATYTNWDAQLEYEAAINITSSGYPVIWTGHLINQPPLGFYISAVFFQIFGQSYTNAVTFTTLWGVAAVAMVYVLGVLLYGRRTGLVASALFGLIPWHVYMSRIFLIDNQSMFWSLLFLVVGVLAVRRNSDRLMGVAGGVFALALLTKLYCVFALPPLLLIMCEENKRGVFEHSKNKFLAFALPVIVTQILWYAHSGLTHQNFLGVYFNTDFISPPVTDPNMFFLPIILSKTAGYLLYGAVAVSVAFVYIYHRELAYFLRTDLICLVAIAVIVALNLVMVLGLHLTVPYVSVFKYTYMALPFFCLLAASITDKGAAVFHGEKWRIQWKKIALIAVGFALIIGSLIESIVFLNGWVTYASFGVDDVTYYPLNLYVDTAYLGIVTKMHNGALGLVLATFGLVLFLDAKKEKKLLVVAG